MSWWPRLERTVGLLATMATLVVAASTLISIKQVNSDQALTLDGQITDRYNAAVANLGNDSQDVRLGGIYALQRIMQDSPRDYATIINVLSAYVRAHAGEPKNNDPGLKQPAQDVEAALSVFGNRRPGWGSDGLVIDLRGTYLRGADLSGTNLTSARLTGADLAGADLGPAWRPMHGTVDDPPPKNTDLSAAFLRDVNLDNASLLSANLEDAILENARLRHADLEDVKLSGATLSDADIRGADLGSADLSYADMRGANLSRVDLTAVGILHGADLDGADLSGANLRGVDLRGTRLGRVKLIGADLRGADLRDTDEPPPDAVGEPQLDVPTLVQARLDHTTKLPARLAKDPRVQKAMEAGDGS